MMAARNNAFTEKKDLHVGGLGANAQAGLATMVDPQAHDSIRPSRRFLRQARHAVQTANHALRVNPLAALGLGAVVGMTVGYLLSRRS
jgi:ElaB/YqjD/DUF883 family membrane-anchored ribosome-binding protein